MWLDGKEYKPYATGGLVDYTGPAMVHGSPTRPEAFLSADDTANMQRLFEALSYVMSSNLDISSSTAVTNTNSNVTVEQIVIQTNELNNNQDFRTAGNILAEEFSNAIRRRGISTNVKR